MGSVGFDSSALVAHFGGALLWFRSLDEVRAMVRLYSLLIWSAMIFASVEQTAMALGGPPACMAAVRRARSDWNISFWAVMARWCCSCWVGERSAREIGCMTGVGGAERLERKMMRNARAATAAMGRMCFMG